MINKLKKSLLWLTRTKIGLFVTSFIWSSSWIGVYNNSTQEWPFWMAVPGFIYMLGLFSVMMAYAWVINPIRDRKQRKETK